MKMDIFNRRRRKRTVINYNTLEKNTKDIPSQIIIRYDEFIEIDKIDEIIKHKYKVLDKLGYDNEEYNLYMELSVDYIKEYNQKKDDYSLQKYLDMCTQFINIKCIQNKKNIKCCVGCDEVIVEEDFDETYICPKCDCINEIFNPTEYSKSDKNTNYEEDTNNFVKVLDKFEGKGSIPDTIYTQLDEYFVGIGLQKGEYYMQQPLVNNKKEHTSKRLLWDALENTKNNKYYDESNILAHMYWGWSLPDLTKYRDVLISDYRKTQHVWNSIKPFYSRSASLGTQFRLYVHLKAIGYECDREDFKIQDMVESLRFHNEVWKIMCDETGLKYFFVS